MIDPFGRAISYVRISVTDRCNLRCVYCMPDGDLGSEGAGAVLAYREIARLTPIKLNMVVMKGVNDDEIEDVARLTFTRPWTIRFIEVMPMRQNPGRQAEQYVSTETILARLAGVGRMFPVERDVHAGPAR